MRNIKETYYVPRDQITPTKHGLPYWTRIVFQHDETPLLNRKKMLKKSNWGSKKRIKNFNNRNLNPKYVNFCTSEIVIVDQSTKSSLSWSFMSLANPIFFSVEDVLRPGWHELFFNIFTCFIEKSNSFLDLYRKM